jgi:hypothetical protein
MMNLPYPAIQMDVSDHCYVTISDVISDFLAHGFLPLQPAIHQSADWITELSQSPKLVSSVQNALALYGPEPFFSLLLKNGKMTMNRNMLVKIVDLFGARISQLYQNQAPRSIYVLILLHFPLNNPIIT